MAFWRDYVAGFNHCTQRYHTQTVDGVICLPLKMWIMTGNITSLTIYHVYKLKLLSFIHKKHKGCILCPGDYGIHEYMKQNRYKKSPALYTCHSECQGYQKQHDK